MKPFKVHSGLIVPLAKSNIDTDAIIPKQFLKSIQRTGFGDNIFDEWRYLDPGIPGKDCTKRPLNSDFELNQARYQGASILITGPNFGCGSSREHAAWGLYEYGFRVIIASSFADIFYNNAVKNGILAIELDQTKIDELIKQVHANPGLQCSVNLEKQMIHLNQEDIPFEIESAVKTKLMSGMDDIEQTLQHLETIKAFEAQHKKNHPWLFNRFKVNP